MPAKEPGPIREALFLDVPYIIDSMFRWGEFRASRVGVVDFERDPSRFIRRSPWNWPFFWLYLVITVFLIFGPTLRGLCGVLGPGGVIVASRVVFAVLVFVIVRIGLSLLSHVLRSLTRRLNAEQRSLREPDAASATASAAPQSQEATRPDNPKPHLPTRAEIRGRIAQTWGALVELGRYAGQLTLHGWLRLGVALLVLLAVIAGALAPLLAAARVALKWQPELIGCFKVEHTLPIWVQVGLVLVIGAGGLIVWSRRGIERPLGQFVVLLALWGASIVFLWSVFVDDASREASTGPYAHVYPIVVFGLSSMALLAFLLSMGLFGKTLWIRDSTEPDKKPESKDWAETYRERLASTRLIRNDRKDPPVEGLRVTAALVNGVGGHPLQALLLPALVAVSFPTDGLLSYTAGAFAVGAALLAYGSLSTRWQQLVVYIDRWFLVGTPLPVSVAAIVLAALRLLDVQYVSTLLDAAPFGTVFRTLTMLYVAAWFFEYWLNYWPGARLLNALGTPIDKHGDVIKLPDGPKSDKAEELQTDGRFLSLHGSGRVCAQGWLERPKPAAWEPRRDSAFSTYDYMGLFRALSQPGDDPDILDTLHRRLQLYFYGVNTLLAVLAGTLWYVHMSYAVPLAADPVVVAHVVPAADGTKSNLLAALEKQARDHRPALIVAASGGGTRAALYTEQALEGLARLQHAKDIVLLSGVSGGGVAAAVFAHRFAALTGTTPGKHPWNDYLTDVTQPFIQDVLDGAGELRIAKSTPLGKLLAESFTHRLFADQPVGMRSLTGPLLILNSTVSGHPAEESALLRGREAIPSRTGDLTLDCNQRSRPFSSLAGSRLVFTTLNIDAGFSTQPDPKRVGTAPADDLPDMRLAYTMLRPGAGPDADIDLAAAAALNANFPPVFPNARVRVIDARYELCERRSFYVTDGGATENLGLLSALYALREAVSEAAPSTTLPPIHLLAIEASAVTYDYTDDRGIGAATGGSKERVTAGLTQELLTDIRTELATRNRGETLEVHYLPLPMAFRSRGGLGTHWMFAQTFRVADPLVAEAPNRFMAYWQGVVSRHPRYEMLTQQDVEFLWGQLFAPQGNFCGEPFVSTKSPTPSEARIQQVQNWICGHEDWDDHIAEPDWQVSAWNKTVSSLSTPPH